MRNLVAYRLFADFLRQNAENLGRIFQPFDDFRDVVRNCLAFAIGVGGELNGNNFGSTFPNFRNLTIFLGNRHILRLKAMLNVDAEAFGRQVLDMTAAGDHFKIFAKKAFVSLNFIWGFENNE